MSWILLLHLLFQGHKIIFRQTSSITVFENFLRYWKQKLTILLTSCSKRLRMRNWDTKLESHGRLDKTVYGESSVQVSR